MNSDATTRDRIIEAGLKVFSEKGYLGATTQKIARCAGVAEVTLFRQFSSKEKLFEEVINRYSFLPALKGLLPDLKDMPYRDALLVIAEEFLKILRQRRDLLRIILGELHRSERLSEISRQFTGEMFKTLALYFREMQAAEKLRSFDAEYAARAFLGMFYAFFIREEFLSGKKIRKAGLNKAVKEFIDIFALGTLKREY